VRSAHRPVWAQAWVTASCLSIGLASQACRGDRWIIAGDWLSESRDAGLPSDSDAAPTAEVCPTVASLDAERQGGNPAPDVDARFAGVWRGNLGGDAAAGFPSAQIELRIADGGIHSLRFDAPAAAPALEPSRGYLCTQSADGVRCATPSGYVGGYSYALEAVMSRGDVLSFQIVNSDPWDGWCRLQAAQAWPDRTQPCGYVFGAGPPGSDNIAGAAGCARVTADGAATAIDCEVMYALQRCRCATDGCVAQPADVIEVGLRLTDGLLIGSLWYEGDLDAAGVTFARP